MVSPTYQWMTLALKSISNLFSDEVKLKAWTTVSTNVTWQLNDLCLRTTYFQFEDQLLEQIDRAAMALPLSHIPISTPKISTPKISTPKMSTFSF